MSAEVFAVLSSSNDIWWLVLNFYNRPIQLKEHMFYIYDHEKIYETYQAAY